MGNWRRPLVIPKRTKPPEKNYVFTIKHMPSGRFIEEIDPATMKSTGRPKQFTSDVEMPTVLEVDWVKYG
jgi:hypothetical protein